MPAGEPESFVQDAVRAELFNNFRTVQERLYDILADHAALTAEIAGGVRDSLLQAGLANAAKAFLRNAERAKEWESSADELVNRARSASASSDTTEFFRLIVEAADDIADELEDAAFHLTLLPPGGTARRGGRAAPLAGRAAGARHAGIREGGRDRAITCGEAVRAKTSMTFWRRSTASSRSSTTADEAQRGIKRALVAGVDDARALFVLSAVARNLEQAADGLMHCGLRIRDHVLGDALAA